MKEPRKIDTKRTHIVRKEVYDLDTEEGRPRIRWLTKWTFDGDRMLLTVHFATRPEDALPCELSAAMFAAELIGGELFHAAPCVRCNRYVRALDSDGRCARWLTKQCERNSKHLMTTEGD